jgi:glycosyltransferase involved in cell wall biosynthesis
MNVLFLTTNYPSPNLSIDGIFVREHARAAAEGADVRVIHIERAAGPALARLEPIEGEDPPAWRLRYRRLGKPVSSAAFLAGPLLGSRRFRREGWRPDVIHAHSFLSALPGLGSGRPLAYTEHWSVFLPENPAELSRPMRAVARLALRRADVVLPVSTALEVALRALAPHARYSVVPNVVDDEVFRPGGRRSKDGTSRLLTAGLLDSDGKGVDVLLEAIERIDSPRVHLDVVGDGAKRSDYERLAGRLGLDGAVSFHGLRTKPELAELMRQADVFVLGSRYENNPCVLIEAMACGLPVVATRVGGVPEVVDSETGIIVEPDDPEALAAGIAAAVEGLDRFDGARSARRAQERFGRSAIARRLAIVYADLLERAR